MLDLEELKSEQLRLKSSGSGNFWKPSLDNFIRVFPFTHKVTPEDVKNGLFQKDKIGKTVGKLYREIVRNFNLTDNHSPVLYNEDINKAYRAAKNVKDEELAKQLRPDRKFVLNIVDMTDEKPAIRVFFAPKSVVTFLIDHIQDKEFGEAVLGLKGRDFRIKYDKEAKDPKEIYRIALRDQDKSKQLPSSIEKGVVDFYNPGVWATFAKPFNGDLPEATNGEGDKPPKLEEEERDPFAD